jgi:hypothetical protein
MTRATICRGAVLLALVTLAAGCGAVLPKQDARHPAGDASAKSAIITSAERSVDCSKPWQQPRALPAGFVADAVVRCSPGLNLANGIGHARFIKQVADRDLAPLLTALREPSLQPPAGVVCADQFTPVPVLFLIGPHGQVARPVIPTNGCGQTLSTVLDALQHVPWVTT